MIKKLINLILSNFAIFLFLSLGFLIGNRQLIFKLANENVNEIDVRAFTYYKKYRKIEGFKFQKMKMLKGNTKQIYKTNIKSTTIFNKDEFLKKIENYKRLLNFIYKIFGFSILILLYKFIKNVRF